MKPTAQTPEVRHEAERVIEERKADLERARRWLGLRIPGHIEGFIDRGPMQVDAMLAAYAREEVTAACLKIRRECEAEERARIVRWLKSYNDTHSRHALAERIERGEHESF